MERNTDWTDDGNALNVKALLAEMLHMRHKK